jgi:O-antigen ligase
MLVSVIPLQQGRTRNLSLLALGVVVMGLLLTFTRAMWMGTLGGVVLMLFAVRGRERQRILRMFAVFAAFVGFLLLILGTVSTESENYVASYIERFTSTFKVESYVAESTIGVRLEEIREAWPRVVERPWLGIGLGGTYSQVPKWDDAQQSHVWRPRTYIHNAFMLVLTKAGVLGLSTLLAMLGVFFWRANRLSRTLRDPTERALVVGAMGATFACVVGSMLQPSLTRAAPVTLLGILWGVLELYRWFQERDDRSAKMAPVQRHPPRVTSNA